MFQLFGIALILVAIHCVSKNNLGKYSHLLVLLAVLVGGLTVNQKMSEGFLGFAPVNHKLGQCGGKNLKPEDGIAQNRMSNWEGVQYQFKDSEPDRKHKWRHPPSNLPLVKDTVIYSPIGDGIKLTQDMTSTYYPSVDGGKDSNKFMFTLANNQCRPGCCPSTYSCDFGCVCTTEQQRDMIAGRGGNRGGKNTYPEI